MTLGTGLGADSARTWRDPADRPPPVPEALRPPAPGTVGPRERHRLLWERHRLRRERALTHLRESQDPERGLPVAPPGTVVRYLRGLLRRRAGLVVVVTLANALAAAAGLAVPLLLGRLVDVVVEADGRPGAGVVTDLALLVVGVLVAQAVLTYLAKWLAAVLGQGVLAEAREHVVRAVLRLPLGKVESASTGDLVTRVTRDVGSMSSAVRWALPEFIIGVVTVLLTVVAMVLNSWALAVPTLVTASLSLWQVRRYLQHAPAAYLLEGATYSLINSTLSETVEGARTVEALGLQPERRRAAADDIEVSSQAERYGLVLRNILFVVMDMAFSLPRVITLVVGAVLYARGVVTLGQITAAMLYIETFYGPFDRLVGTIDELQVGIASTTRLLGIAEVPPDRTPGEALPAGRELVGRGLRYAYREGQDVLHGIDLTLRPGERLAVVGPSGSGKSTLGRLLSGIHGPGSGSVTVGGVELVRLPLDALRREVALVTQEHHVFRGSVRDNLVLAREGASDDEVWRALATVDASTWVAALPRGLDTVLGAGNQVLTPAQAQQVALARLILADPHTLVLDEATSLIDPRTARHLEGSMSALLTNRTVVAIAHRLHTAHDADRIAVVQDGRIVELGSHDELMEADGEYAALWRAWTS
ncbi:ABC transporter ATP-binding protein [Ornithinimicrobium pekingense]|uniref:Multidrug ABC transporter ATP-binding protein n=1 Tax=Ornithinimicrobium pekingense TaxID=384677 RepID=A0ABQ2F6H6_9MICO|nr:ABC transporter ATP-binding protein [Ornithinimicrobium pekingense]GGK64513.1 multidrug ABC transporter ATP-binding protein [Ornithinimicrobium pekingense]